MSTLSVEIKRNLARGDQKVGNKFSGAVRSLETLSLEVGDKFTIPEEFEVYRQKLDNNVVEYIMVEMANGNAKSFYPSTFTKTRRVYDEDGMATDVRVSTKGSAAELFRQYPSVQEGMEALKGKTLEVTDIELVPTMRFNGNGIMKAQIPTIEIVEK